MIRCEYCRFYMEQFDYDDWSGEVFDYCKCARTDDLLDNTERESCEDYEPID